jgi:signal transduction histidine kinase
MTILIPLELRQNTVPFFDEERHRRGTGLGLSITNNHQAHGGSLQVESNKVRTILKFKLTYQYK